MAFPTDFTSMLAYMNLLMQDTSSVSSALTASEKTDLLNSAIKVWSAEINPRILTQSGTGVGLDWTSAGTGRSQTTSTNIAEILQVFSTSSSNADIGTLMERIELHEMLALQASDTSQSSTPTKWALQRVDTTIGAQVNTWKVFIHPLSDGTAFVALAIRLNPATMTGSELPNLSDEEKDYVCRLAAWDGARLAGRSPEFRDAIIAPIPEKAKVFLRKYKGIIRPTKRLEEEPV